MNFLGFIVDKGLLSVDDRKAVENEIAGHRPLSEALAERGVSLVDALTEVGKAYSLPSRVLGDPPGNEEVLKYIPIDSARHYGFVPLAIVDGALEVGITDPDNIDALDALQFISGKIGIPYKIFLITQEDFDRVLNGYQNLSGEIGRALTEYDTVGKPAENASFAKKDKGVLSLDDVSLPSEGSVALNGPRENLKEDAPVTKIVSTILRYAIEGFSSRCIP